MRARVCSSYGNGFLALLLYLLFTNQDTRIMFLSNLNAQLTFHSMAVAISSGEKVDRLMMTIVEANNI